MENVCDGINGAAENTLVRPGRSGYDSDRGIARIAALFQCRHDLIDRLDREENAHGCLMCGKKRELFLRRDRCAAFHTGDDDGLRNARQGIFLFQRSCCRKEGADARNDRKLIFFDPCCAQTVHLFLDRTVNGWIACVHTSHHFACFERIDLHLQHFIQIHGRTVVDLCIFSAVLQDLWIHKRAGVDDDIRLCDETLSLHRDELRIPRACADEIQFSHNNFLLNV